MNKFLNIMTFMVIACWAIGFFVFEAGIMINTLLVLATGFIMLGILAREKAI